MSALCGPSHCLCVLRKQVNPGQLSEFVRNFPGFFNLALGGYAFSWKPKFFSTDGTEELLVLQTFAEKFPQLLCLSCSINSVCWCLPAGQKGKRPWTVIFTQVRVKIWEIQNARIINSSKFLISSQKKRPAAPSQTAEFTWWKSGASEIWPLVVYALLLSETDTLPSVMIRKR